MLRLNKVPGVILFFLVADGGLVLAYLADWSIGGLYWKVTALLDPRGQADLVNWYASVKLFLIAFLFTVFARDQIDRRAALAWLLLAFPLIFAMLSFDEIAQMSTWLVYKSARLLPASLLHGVSPLQRQRALLLTSIVGVLVLALSYCLAHFTRGKPAIRLKYVFGLLAYAGPAAAEAFVPIVAVNHTPGVLRIAVHELTALLGGTLMLWATHDLLTANDLSLHTGRGTGSARETRAN